MYPSIAISSFLLFLSLPRDSSSHPHYNEREFADVWTTSLAKRANFIGATKRDQTVSVQKRQAIEEQAAQRPTVEEMAAPAIRVLAAALMGSQGTEPALLSQGALATSVGPAATPEAEDDSDSDSDSGEDDNGEESDSDSDSDEDGGDDDEDEEEEEEEGGEEEEREEK